MTLKEYLESYDESLDEGIGDNIKEKIKKFKDNAKNVALTLGVIATILGTLTYAGIGIKSIGQGIKFDSYISRLQDSKKYIEYEIKDNNDNYKTNISPELIEKADKQMKAAENVLNDLEKAYNKTKSFLPSKKQNEKFEEAMKKAETSIKICNQVREEIWQQSANDRDAREFNQMRKTNKYYINSGNIDWLKPAINQNHYKTKKWRYPYIKK